MGSQTQNGQALIELLAGILIVTSLFLFSFFVGETLKAESTRFRFQAQMQNAQNDGFAKTRKQKRGRH